MKNKKTTVNSLKTKRISKSILVMQLLCLLLMTLSSQAASPSPAPSPEQDITKKITGTWLYLWWHGNVSVGNADGKTTEQTIFTPESYGEAGDQKTDSFMRFRPDGTGTYFNRHIMFKNKNKTLAVITQSPDGAWVENDVLASRYEFTWEVRENQLVISPAKGAPRFTRGGKYDFSFNNPPTRPATKEIQKIFDLKDELIINMFGQFLRLGEKVENDLNNRYGIL